MTTFTRAFPLEDISIRAGGDGRTVEAYAAVFNHPVDIVDQQGRYREQIHPQAFQKTLGDNGLRFGVFYNHASTIQGTPSELASVPIGTPLEIRADAKGLFTVTRYLKTPFADQVLEAINSGAITGQSFSGRFVGSNPKMPAGGYGPNARTSELPLVTRTAIQLREYGPTPFPAYADAAIVGVRNLDQQTIDRLLALAIRLESEDEPDQRTDISEVETVTEAPQLLHAGRSLNARVRAALIARGIAS